MNGDELLNEGEINDHYVVNGDFNITPTGLTISRVNYRDHPGRQCPTGEHVVFFECDCIEEDEILRDTDAETDTSVEDQGMIVDPEEVLDTLVEKASKPTLAMLFQLGKDKGLIAPVAGYGGEGTGA